MQKTGFQCIVFPQFALGNIGWEMLPNLLTKESNIGPLVRNQK